MATSDEETDRGVAGGDPTEPSQPIRETAGRSETLTAAFLRFLQAAPRRMTLETRLGIATVTLLVFTFGLLVYRKVELHQQKLMQVRAGAVSPDAGQTIPRKSPQRPADREVDTELPQGLAEFAAGDPPQPAAEDISPTRFPTAEPDPEPGPGFDRIVSDNRFSSPDSDPSSQRGGSEFELPTPAVDVDIVDLSDSDVGQRSALEFSPADEPVEISAADEFAELPEPEPELPEPEMEPEPVLTETIPLVNGRDEDFDPFTDEATAAIEVSPVPSVSPVPAGVDEDVVAADAEAQPRMELAMLEPQPSFGAEQRGFAAEGSRSATEENGFGPEDNRFETETALPSITPLAQPQLGADLAGFPDLSAADATGPRSNSAPRLPPSDRAGTELADSTFSLAGFNYQNTETGQTDDGATYQLAEVQEGDNYSRISKRVYGSSRYFSALAVVNQHRISDPRKMRPGMKLLVPPREVLEAQYPHLFSGPVKGAAGPIGFIVREDGTAAYHVSEGDTLSGISARFLGRSSRWIEIFRRNQDVLRDPNKLKTGTVLELPGDAVEVNIAH